MSIIWIEKTRFSQTVFQSKRSRTCDLIRKIPEANYMGRLKSIIFIMNGTWISFRKIAGHSKISKHARKEESEFNMNSSPNRHICLGAHPSLSKRARGATSAGLLGFKSQLNYLLVM